MNGSAWEALARANRRIAIWLAWIAAFALTLIALVTFGDVVGRYFFHAPFAFTVELTQMAMAIIVFFGVGLVTHDDAHICADIVTMRLPDRLRTLLGLVTNLLAIGFIAVMSWQLWLYAFFLYGKGDTTQVWTVPLWPIAFGVALGSVFILTGLFLLIAGAARRLTGQAEEMPGQTAPEIAALSSPE
jgi:TRAP-type C4-dicarboxylate transport system permease small subunit